MMYPFMTLNDDTEITHSEMKIDGTVKVYIETPDETGGLVGVGLVVVTGTSKGREFLLPIPILTAPIVIRIMAKINTPINAINVLNPQP